MTKTIEEQVELFKQLKSRLSADSQIPLPPLQSWRQLFVIDPRYEEAFPRELEALDKAWAEVLSSSVGKQLLSDIARTIDKPLKLSFSADYSMMSSVISVNQPGDEMTLNTEIFKKFFVDKDPKFIIGKTNQLMSGSLAAALVHEGDHLLRAKEKNSQPCAEKLAMDREAAFRAETSLPARKDYIEVESALRHALRDLTPDQLKKIQTIRETNQRSPTYNPLEFAAGQAEQLAANLVYLNQGCQAKSDEEIYKESGAILTRIIQDRTAPGR